MSPVVHSSVVSSVADFQDLTQAPASPGGACFPVVDLGGGRLNADAVLARRDPEPDAVAPPDQASPADRLISPAHARFSDAKADLGVQTVELDRLAAGMQYLEGRK